MMYSEEVSTSKPALWTRNFTTCAAANFLLFFSFYQLLPILPMFIIEKFQTDNATAGIVISLYTIGALACRPFAGFLVDTLSRKPLYFWTFFAFTLCFIGYKTLGLIPLLAVLRFMHGLCFGISTTASNTVAIDALPASRRGEGIGYFGISVNLAFATGPMTGMFLYEAFGDNIVFAISIILCVIGLILVQTLKVAPKEKKPHAPLSLDRFFLTRAVPQFANFIFVGFAYGPVTNYIALYAKELGISGSGWFYALIAAGLILNRVMTGRLIDRGYLIHLVGTGMTLNIIAYFMLAFSHSPVTFFASAFLIGTSLGLIFPGYQTMCVNLARHDQRGTANSTYLSGWDIGIGIGILVGGSMAEHFGMHQPVFLACAVALVIADILYFTWTARHYLRNKLEG
ncbi:MFS transporter [uncultured Fibrobacter sp.]|uniref:MFS transporter n=1 Tax=uncultured Fibrobacter sp. TaxID=261512 RepID=UPI0025E84A32|nr:MFS transporter [uncultured Fibrobacter sp.]